MAAWRQPGGGGDKQEQLDVVDLSLFLVLLILQLLLLLLVLLLLVLLLLLNLMLIADGAGDVAAADVVIFTAPQAFALGHGLCLVRAAPLLLVLGRVQGLVLLEGLASEGLPDPGVWGGSRPKPSPRSRPRPGHLHVASTSRGPFSCEYLERARGQWPPPRLHRQRECRHAVQELLCRRCR